MLSGVDRTSNHAIGARTTIKRNADRGPGGTPTAREHDGTDDGKRDHETDAHRERSRVPIAHVSRRRNHLPTIARLTIDNAVCPKPRVRVTNTNSAIAAVT